jgi:hypothetical protein
MPTDAELKAACAKLADAFSELKTLAGPLAACVATLKLIDAENDDLVRSMAANN